MVFEEPLWIYSFGRTKHRAILIISIICLRLYHKYTFTTDNVDYATEFYLG